MRGIYKREISFSIWVLFFCLSLLSSCDSPVIQLPPGTPLSAATVQPEPVTGTSTDQQPVTLPPDPIPPSPVSGTSTDDRSLQIHPSALQQIEALLEEKESRSPAQKKIDSHLLLGIKKERGDKLFNAVPELRSSLQREDDGKILVDIKADVTPAILEYIVSLDGVIVNSFPQYHAIRARLPPDKIETLAQRSEVQSIRLADQAITHKINTSEGDVTHRTNLARASFGATGKDIKICAMSDSVDYIAEVQASGDLPPDIDILPGQSGNGTGEGTAMLEIIHDLAPEAPLGFATAFGSEAGFADNILKLNVAGCKVIVDDVGYYREPVFQDGIVAQAVNTVVAKDPSAGGSLYFSSAGNSGNKNDGTSGVWEGDFVPTSAPSVLAGKGIAHDFGGTNFNRITKDTSYFLRFSGLTQWVVLRTTMIFIF